MSFSRYNTEDSVISSETVVRGLWSGDSATLSAVATSSTQAAASKFYLDVYNAGEVAFSIEYAHISGSGSTYFNSSVTSSTSTKVVYGQYRNLIYGSEEATFQIGGSTVNSDGGESFLPGRNITVNPWFAWKFSLTLIPLISLR